MESKGLKRALAIVFALSSFLISSPSAGAPVSLRLFAEQELRLATIAYSISTATAAECRDPQVVTGLLLHDLSAYDRRVRLPISHAFSLNTGIGVIQIVSGSAADRAGLQIDDEILSVGGISVEDVGAISQRRKSYRRVKEFTRVLTLALRDGPTQLSVRRQGAIVQKTLAPQLGCGGEISLLRSKKFNAWSDGDHVVVSTSMMKLARSDDELAFVVAHEMAHNILGHSSHSSRGIFGVRLGAKRQEHAADYMAVWLMTEGGFKAEGGIDFLRSARQRLWWNVSLDHPGFGSRIKNVAGVVRSAMDSPVWALAHSKALGTVTAGVPPGHTQASEPTQFLLQPSYGHLTAGNSFATEKQSASTGVPKLAGASLDEVSAPETNSSPSSFASDGDCSGRQRYHGAISMMGE
ncbi:MAG: M48 family metalloprotease [Sphingomicrobium sp.]